MVYNGHLITATLGSLDSLRFFNGMSRESECAERPPGRGVCNGEVKSNAMLLSGSDLMAKTKFCSENNGRPRLVQFPGGRYK